MDEITELTQYRSINQIVICKKVRELWLLFKELWSD
jgi:hypothetical protein